MCSVAFDLLVGRYGTENDLGKGAIVERAVCDSPNRIISKVCTSEPHQIP